MKTTKRQRVAVFVSVLWLLLCAAGGIVAFIHCKEAARAAHDRLNEYSHRGYAAIRAADRRVVYVPTILVVIGVLPLVLVGGRLWIRQP